jgi:nicotinamide-nucleotide amidase
MFPEELLSAADTALLACEAQGITMVTAESCTGGLISAALTAIAGSSRAFEAGFVTYANSAKEAMLGIAPSLIRTQGAVSEAVAKAMARGALEYTAAGLAVGVTGVAGPDGGTPDKPVGLVHMAVATSEGAISHRTQVFAGDRDSVRLQAAIATLAMVPAILKGED